MGKYMRRKCRGAAAPASGVLGVRTRSRAATAVVAGDTPAKNRKQAAETSTTAGPPRVVDEALSVQDGGDAGGGCYLHLRSRKLFKPAAAAVAPEADLASEEASTSRLANSGTSGEAIAVTRISRCSSTASSTVDVTARAHSGGEAEASKCRDVESSVSDSQCNGRERRETTPSSRPPVDYTSDLEPSQARDERSHKRCRRSPATTTISTAAFHQQSRARMPAPAEIDEFFRATEKAQAERFAAKYNFDVALGVPLNSGRFEWTLVATI